MEGPAKPRQRCWRRVLRVALASVGIVVGLYLAALLVLLPFRNRFTYSPRPLDPAIFGARQTRFSYERVQTRLPPPKVDAVWIARTADPAGPPVTLVFYHGIEGNLWMRFSAIEAHLEHLGFRRFNVLLASYRGYGSGEGSPEEEGVRQDALDAFLYARQRAPGDRLVLYGQSFGAAVALWVASQRPADVFAVVAENAFLTLSRAISTAKPYFFIFSFVTAGAWDSASRVDQLAALERSGTRIPRFVFTFGELDTFVSPSNSRELHRRLSDAGADARLVPIPAAGHNDTIFSEGYAERWISQLAL